LEDWTGGCLRWCWRKVDGAVADSMTRCDPCSLHCPASRGPFSLDLTTISTCSSAFFLSLQPHNKTAQINLHTTIRRIGLAYRLSQGRCRVPRPRLRISFSRIAMAYLCFFNFLFLKFLRIKMYKIRSFTHLYANSTNIIVHGVVTSFDVIYPLKFAQFWRLQNDQRRTSCK